MKVSAQLAALGVIALAIFAVDANEENIQDDLATRPREGRVEFERHPLYENLHKENRRLLDLGEVKELPNYVEGGDGVLYGDSVDGYNLPDSFSSAPSYADPTLLTAVMTQAEEANFRYPIRTTVPPASRVSTSDSEEDKPESNDINPFMLFPPQFHDLLEIPLHTYSNGSSYSPHSRKETPSMGPLLISKGYANTKIQGGVNMRPQSDQGTPEVVYSPTPIFSDGSEQTTNRENIPSSKTTTSTRRKTATKTTASTTRNTATTTTSTTTTLTPKRKIYASPPPRVPLSSSSPTQQPSTRRQSTTPYSSSSQVPSQSHISSRPHQTQLPPLISATTTEVQDSPDRIYNQAATPTKFPSLRYTRRPTTPYPTTPYYTTPRPTTPPPVTQRSTLRPATTTQSNIGNENYVTERQTPSRVRGRPYGTRIPSRVSSARPTETITLSPIPIGQSESKTVPPQTSTSRPQPENNEESEDFRPSKLDPYLRLRLPLSTYRPPTSNTRSDYSPQGSPEVLPPVVNTYEVTTERSKPQFARRPAPPSFHSSTGLTVPSLPPPPRRPSRPLLPPPPFQRPPSLPLTPQSLNVPYQPSPLLPANRPSLVPPPPPSPSQRPNRPALSPPPRPTTNEFINNEIKPLPPAPLSDNSVALSKPQNERIPHPLSSFGPPHPSSLLRPGPNPSVARPSRRPAFQIVRPVVTPPPRPQDIVHQPEPGFTLPVEAGNLPKRKIINADSGPIQPQSNGPNILPQFRPNAPRQQENFSIQDSPQLVYNHNTRQEPSERIYNTNGRPVRPDKRPVLSKRPSFLESFNFFRRSPVNRRRGETGPLIDTNNPEAKIPKKQSTAERTAALHYQLTHGALPKHAQKVVVIGPFKQPPPGAPVIPVPSKSLLPPLNSDIPLPLPPLLPSREDSPPPIQFPQPMSSELHVSKKGYFDQDSELNKPQILQKKPLGNLSVNLTKKDTKIPSSEVVYGQPFNIRLPAQAISREEVAPSDSRITKQAGEVSEEHKEAIIAGKFKFPSLSGIDRSGAEDGNALPQNIIPLPVPILPQGPNSGEPFKWSIFGFDAVNPKPSVSERIITEPQGIQQSPSPPSSLRMRLPRPPVPSHLQHLENRLNKNTPRRRNPPRIDRFDGPATYFLPPPPPPINSVNLNPHQRVDANETRNLRTTAKTPTNPVTTISTTSKPKVVTFVPYALSTKKPSPTKPRPVYRHTSSTQRPTTLKPKTTMRTDPSIATERVTSTTQAPVTSQPVTPMRITEYNPYTEYRRKPESLVMGGFKAPEIKSSDYGGWKVVGVPPTPSEGPGDALSPVVSYVKENTPEIIIKSPARSTDNADIVTGVISDRMGEVDDDGQLVQYSSQFNVETPGIVRSYWVQPPTLG